MHWCHFAFVIIDAAKWLAVLGFQLNMNILTWACNLKTSSRCSVWNIFAIPIHLLIYIHLLTDEGVSNVIVLVLTYVLLLACLNTFLKLSNINLNRTVRYRLKITINQGNYPVYLITNILVIYFRDLIWTIQFEGIDFSYNYAPFRGRIVIWYDKSYFWINYLYRL